MNAQDFVKTYFKPEMTVENALLSYARHLTYGFKLKTRPQLDHLLSVAATALTLTDKIHTNNKDGLWDTPWYHETDNAAEFVMWIAAFELETQERKINLNDLGFDEPEMLTLLEFMRDHNLLKGRTHFLEEICGYDLEEGDPIIPQSMNVFFEEDPAT